MEKLNIKDFSMNPGPRYISEGFFSGELYREEHLKPALERAIKTNSKIIVNFDGVMGYGTSFLEEVFGGLSREYPDVNILDYIDFISEEEPYLIDEIKEYIEEAKNQHI